VRALLAHGVQDRQILEAFRRVRRERFVPPEWVVEAYRDRPIPIPHGQVTTQPSLIGQMIEALRLNGTERVLEVGTGLGFQTALLSMLAGQVFSIERFADLAEWAERNLRTAGIDGVTVVVGDGTLGLSEQSPYDAMLISAAAPRIPDPLVEQLAEGGRVVHPVGSGGEEMVTVFRKRGDGLVREVAVVPAHFVRLVGRHGLAEDRPDLTAG
jgi:protein-L-isoaspartate(D-aspartate) O-methyltransferase